MGEITDSDLIEELMLVINSDGIKANKKLKEVKACIEIYRNKRSKISTRY